MSEFSQAFIMKLVYTLKPLVVRENFVIQRGVFCGILSPCTNYGITTLKHTATASLYLFFTQSVNYVFLLFKYANYAID